MSQIKYLQQTYGGTPFMFFEDKAAAEAAGTAGQIPDGVVVCTLNDTIGQMMAAMVGYDNTESGLDATDVQGAVDEICGKVYQYEERTYTSMADLLSALTTLTAEEILLTKVIEIDAGLTQLYSYTDNGPVTTTTEESETLFDVFYFEGKPETKEEIVYSAARSVFDDTAGGNLIRIVKSFEIKQQTASFITFFEEKSIATGATRCLVYHSNNVASIKILFPVAVADD